MSIGVISSSGGSVAGAAYAAAVLADAPAIYCRGDVYSSGLADSSGNSRPLNNLFLTAPTATAGGPKLATATEWGGSAGLLRTTYTQAQPTVGCFECYVQVPTAYPAADLTLMSWSTIPNDGNGATSSLQLLTTGKLRLQLYSGGFVNLDGGTAIGIGGQVHVAAKWGAGGSVLRVDKSSTGKGNTGATTSCLSAATAALFVHGKHDGSGVITGHTGAVKMGEIAWHSTKLSDVRTDAHADAA